MTTTKSTTTKSTARDAAHQALYDRAHAAGMAACAAAVPEPMVAVVGTPGGNESLYVISEGACGYAWVTVRPGNSSFARWVMRESAAGRLPNGAHAGYYGGVEIWVRAGGQSLARKEAYAEAFAEVLRAEGLNAYAGSRLD